MTKPRLRELVTQHGLTGRLVRAVCREEGWRYTAQGAPAEWYSFWNVTGYVLEQLMGEKV